MPLCLLGAGKVVTLAVAGFTLAWTHTVENIPWEEDWQIDGTRLVLETSRIKGSGAGMDPPPESRLVDGWFTWHPDATRDEVILRRAPQKEVGDWRICPREPGGETGPCVPLGSILDADPVTLRACESAAPVPAD